MKILLLISALAFFSGSLFAQADNCYSDADYNNVMRKGLMGHAYTNSLSNYRGVSQYFFPWTQGSITCVNGEVIDGIYLRFDEYSNELLWLRYPDNRIGVLANPNIHEFTLNDNKSGTTYRFANKWIRLPFYSDSSDVFLQVLAEGPLSFYAYRHVIQTANDFVLNPDIHYLLCKDNKYYYVRLSRHQLVRCPLVDRTRMKQVLRTNHVSPSLGEKEFARAVELYNQQSK